MHADQVFERPNATEECRKTVREFSKTYPERRILPRKGAMMLDANGIRALIVLKEQLLARREEIERQIAEIDRQVKGMLEAGLPANLPAPAPKEPVPLTLVPSQPSIVAVPPPALPPEPAIDVDDPESF